tara:strand:- start:715 stop:1266 length:552 start_codon:yes stop_codon:yes gene_type:complete
MEISEAIRKRRTIHIFSKKCVPNEVVEKSINAANLAPCHRKTFPWRFTRLGIKKRELLYQLQLTLKFGSEPTNDSNTKKIRDKMLSPSHLLIASQLCTENPVQKREDYAACACAIQNLSLSLVEDGVGCKWSTGKITTDPKTYLITEINPMDEEIIGFIWIGYGTIPPFIKRPATKSIYRERE